MGEIDKKPTTAQGEQELGRLKGQEAPRPGGEQVVDAVKGLSKAKLHTIYTAEDGTRLPSVTTVLGILAKPALIHWAWDLGVKGLDYRKIRDSAGDIGTLAHYFILCHLRGVTPDTSEYSAQDIGKAETCLLKFYEWERLHPLKVILAEKPLVSERWRFGGTIDCFCELDGQPTLLDFKTGKALYSEATMQISTYAYLLKENGYIPHALRLLRIGRDENEGFEEKVITNYDTAWQIFLRCLDIYNLQKLLKS